MNHMTSSIPKTQPKTAEAPRFDLEQIAEASQKRYDAGRFAPKDEDALWRLAETWYYAMLLPEAYYPPLKSEKNPNGHPFNARYEKGWSQQGISRAVIVMRYGASLGVLPEQAIRLIYIVEGQPSPAAGLMLALAFSSGLLKREDWRVVESSAKKVIVEVFGRSRSKPELITTIYDDYRHLHGKTNWKNYPEDMLVARAISRAMRRYFPDMFAGVYAAEERADMRQDKSVAESVDRILAAVDETPVEDMAPPPAAMEPQEPPVDRVEEARKLLADITNAGEQSDWDALKGRAAAFVGTEHDAALRKAWTDNVNAPRGKRGEA